MLLRCIGGSDGDSDGDGGGGGGGDGDGGDSDGDSDDDGVLVTPKRNRTKFRMTSLRSSRVLTVPKYSPSLKRDFASS